MKTLSIFDFSQYRAFLNAYIDHSSERKHGEKSRIAEAIHCHNAYFSNVMNGKANFSLEQAQDLAIYLGLSKAETEFLFLLVSHERAGTQNLRTYYLEKIREVEEKRLRLENRITPTKTIKKEDQSIYFSSWHYSVIHLMITTLQGFTTLSALQKALGLPAETIREAIEFLETSNLVRKVGAKYVAEKTDIFLGADNALVRSHHSHWRLQAIRALEKRNSNDLHYSSVVTVNQDDFLQIRKMILKFLEEQRKKVSDSTQEDTVAILALDWFTLL